MISKLAVFDIRNATAFNPDDIEKVFALIRAMPGEDVQLFFQKLPTAGWGEPKAGADAVSGMKLSPPFSSLPSGEPEVEVLLSRAFVLSTLYPRINEPPRAAGS